MSFCGIGWYKYIPNVRNALRGLYDPLRLFYEKSSFQKCLYGCALSFCAYERDVSVSAENKPGEGGELPKSH